MRLRYTPPSPFDYGLFADDWVFVNGPAILDSYDSCTAPYDPSNPGTNGDVGTNGTAGCEKGWCVYTAATVMIKGEAAVGMGGDPTLDIDNNGTITGDQTALAAPKDMTPKSDPGGGTSIGGLTIDGISEETLTTGSYRTPFVTVVAKAKLYIKGEVTLYVEDDLTITGTSAVIVTPGSALTLYVSGDVDIGGTGIVNQTQLPQNLTLYGTSTSDDDVHIHGTTAFYGAIYAPTADIRVDGANEIYGALIGQTLTTTSNIHYDECLGAGTGEDDPFRVVFWRKD